jgi:hypothetical protein
VYAIFGIPMFLILLADFGKLFTRGIKFLWAFVRRLYYTGSCRKVRRTVPMQVSAISFYTIMPSNCGKGIKGKAILGICRAIAQAVSRWLPTAAVRVQTRV